jgi:hypothetical protein
MGSAVSKVESTKDTFDTKTTTHSVERPARHIACMRSCCEQKLINLQLWVTTYFRQFQNMEKVDDKLDMTDMAQ